MGLLTAHHTAVTTRLTAAPVLADKIEDAVREAASQPVKANYLVVSITLWSYIDGRRLTSADTAAGDVGLDVTVRAIAVNGAGIRGLLDVVREQLVGHRLIVTGRAVTALGDEDLDDVGYDSRSQLLFQELTLSATSSRT